MKNKIGLLLASLLILTGCGNRDVLDIGNNKYSKALIKMPDDSIVEIEINNWRDYDGEQIQIEGKDGKRYLTSSYNCILIEE